MSEKKIPVIALTKFSPYMIIDPGKIVLPGGEEITSEAVATLCRCGSSTHKPFCDGSHETEGINGEKHPERAEYRWKDYRGENITVHYNLGVCSHDGSCVKMLPAVFNANLRPWIYPDNGSVDDIINVIKHCPSGALKYTIDGKTETDYYHGKPYIKVARKGPLEFYGGWSLKDDQGSSPETEDHFTLCRCGHSDNKPFCDGKHLKTRFQG